MSCISMPGEATPDRADVLHLDAPARRLPMHRRSLNTPAMLSAVHRAQVRLAHASGVSAAGASGGATIAGRGNLARFQVADSSQERRRGGRQGACAHQIAHCAASSSRLACITDVCVIVGRKPSRCRC